MSSDLLQARVKALPFVAAAAVVLFGAHKYFPEWYGPKANGLGTQPATWQGWAVSLTCDSVVGVAMTKGRRS